MKNKVFLFSFVVVFFGIGVLSLIPPKSGVELGDHDKWNHFIAYLALSLNWSVIEKKSKVLFIGLLFCCCYGLSLEYLQGFVPGRVPSWLDALANLGGVLSGFVLYYLMNPQRFG